MNVKNLIIFTCFVVISFVTIFSFEIIFNYRLKGLLPLILILSPLFFMSSAIKKDVMMFINEYNKTKGDGRK